MNKVFLVGRLTKDPDLRYTPNGAAVCNFTVACDKRDKDGNKDADFIDCVTWNKSAENLAQYMSKGRQIAVEGRVDVSSYEKDGQRRWKTKIVCNNIEFLGSGNGNGGNNATTAQQQQAQGGKFGQPIDFNDADLPW